MAYDECPQTHAETKKNEAILIVGVFGVAREQGLFVEENGFCFHECHSVFARVARSLARIPNEAQLGHFDRYTYDVVGSPAFVRSLGESLFPGPRPSALCTSATRFATSADSSTPSARASPSTMASQTRSSV